MRIFQSVALAVAGFVLGTSALAGAQSTDLTEKHSKVYGYVDLESGQFHPGHEVAATPETTPTLKTLTGVISTTFTIALSADTLKVLPKGYTILCDVDVTASVDGFAYAEVGSAAATVSGDTAKCTVNVPYIWVGPTTTTASAYNFTGTYKVTASYAPGGATQALTDFNVIRQTTGVLGAEKGTVETFIPASGTTTSFAVEPTI